MTPSSVTNRGNLLPGDVDNVSVRSGKVHSHRTLASMIGDTKLVRAQDTLP